MPKKKTATTNFSLFQEVKSLWSFLGQSNLRIWLFTLLFFYLLIQPGTGYYENLQLKFQPPLVHATGFDDFSASPYPLFTGNRQAPALSAEGIVVTDLGSMVPMYEKNSRLRLRPASLTKLMTALVALDSYKTNEILTVQKLGSFPAESEMGLRVGDQVSVQTLLYGLLIPSGNDAAYTLAENYPGGLESFVDAMNRKAATLSMFDTHFENPSGVDSPNHFSTPKDMTFLTSVALKNPIIGQIVTIQGINVHDQSGKRTYLLKNVNQLLGSVAGVDGVKTGFTTEAGQCLITSATRDSHRVVIVLMGSSDRFGESAKLLDWVFSSFTWTAAENLPIN